MHIKYSVVWTNCHRAPRPTCSLGPHACGRTLRGSLPMVWQVWNDSKLPPSSMTLNWAVVLGTTVKGTLPEHVVERLKAVG